MPQNPKTQHMLTARKLFPFLLLVVIALCSADCNKKPKTEAEFIKEDILTTGMNTRVNGLQDLLYFSALQNLNACQTDCEKFSSN